MQPTTREERHREIRRQAGKDLMRGPHGHPSYLWEERHRPTADDIEILDLGDLAAKAEESATASAEAVKAADTARRHANALTRDKTASTADRDMTELEATTLEREARPLGNRAYNAALDLLTEYRMRMPTARARYAEKAAEQHTAATEAHAALIAALDARDEAWDKAGRPDARRHYTADVGPQSLGNPGTVTRARDLMARIVSEFPARRVEQMTEEIR